MMIRLVLTTGVIVAILLYLYLALINSSPALQSCVTLLRPFKRVGPVRPPFFPPKHGTKADSYKRMHTHVYEYTYICNPTAISTFERLI